ncbi:MAG TPA: hypothetical protein VEU62_24300 [Bryobacterales bacterium]|nr:hypothetical protein [Bryobacterales bacterium]
MISQRLLRLIQQNADRLTNDLIAEVRHDPRTAAYHKLSEEDLHERALDLFHNLGQWLSSRTEFAVKTRYEAFGRRRCQENIPFSQVLFALTTAKSILLDFIRGAIAAESAAELPLEHELAMAVSQFYDKALYHAAAGYEDAAKAAQASPPAAEAAVARTTDAVAQRKPLSREEKQELGLEVSRSGDIGESAG